jgi:hypothetical protein
MSMRTLRRAITVLFLSSTFLLVPLLLMPGPVLWAPLLAFPIVLAAALWGIGAMATRRATSRGGDTGKAYQRAIFLVTALAFVIYLPYFVIFAILTRHYDLGEPSEASAIADLRSLANAEIAYATANGGFYDEPRCLLAPSGCIPGYSPTAPVFLKDIQISRPQRGYVLRFQPGRHVREIPPAKVNVKTQSPTSVDHFAWTAVPEKPGEPGVRGFCIDDTGRITYTRDGTEPPVKDGRCMDCLPVPTLE